MNPVLLKQLKEIIKGDVITDEEKLKEYSHDTSIFEVKPQAVVSPKDGNDIKNLIKFVTKNKKSHTDLSLTARSAGTDMSGGAINDSIIISFQKYFNKIISFKDRTIAVQPGVFYRDFEKETLKKNLIFPPYPSSREICAMGGIIGNDAGGEKSLQYGKTKNY